MYATQEKDNKANIIAAAVSLAFGIILFLILFFWIIVIPDPPFAPGEYGGGGGGGGSAVEVNVGMYNPITDEVTETQVGEVTDVITEETPEIKETVNGEPVYEEPVKPKVTTSTNPNPVTVVPVKPKPKNSILDNYIKNPKNNNANPNDNPVLNPTGPPGGTTSGSTGGSTAGSTGGSTAGSTGGSTAGSTGGTGPGTGPSDLGGVKINLTGRKRLSKPCVISDVHESGIVEVIIVVDESGKIIKANPNGKGTLTNSANLKSIAKHAVDCVTFSAAPAGTGEQTGSITFNFVFN